MKRLLIAAALSVAFAGDASAMTGDKLQTLCGPARVFGSPNPYTHQAWGDLNLCFGFIDGASDGMLFAERHFCMPDKGVTYGIMAKVVLGYLDKHPERLHLNALFLVDEAFAQAYPCPSKSTDKGAGR